MKKFMNMLAFIGIVVVAIALLIAKILALVDVSAGAVTALQMVGECIAYIVTMVYAFYYVKKLCNVFGFIGLNRSDKVPYDIFISHFFDLRDFIFGFGNIRFAKVPFAGVICLNNLRNRFGFADAK